MAAIWSRKMANNRIWPALTLLLVLLSACATEGLAPAPAAGPTDGPAPTLAPRYYTVQPGDSLWGIADALGVDADMLITVNEIDDPSLIQPGQRLLISDKVTVSGRVLPTPTATPFPCQQGCAQPPDGCEIKGVIAKLDGTKIYVLPEDELYDLRGADKWFCRVLDAESAGWVRWTEYGPALE